MMEAESTGSALPAQRVPEVETNSVGDNYLSMTAAAKKH